MKDNFHTDKRKKYRINKKFLKINQFTFFPTAAAVSSFTYDK
jgi:hypothetical protein